MAKGKNKKKTPGHSMAEGFVNASKPMDDCALEAEAEVDKGSYVYGEPAGPGGYSRSTYPGGLQSYRSPYGDLMNPPPTRNELAAGHPHLRQADANPDNFLSRTLRRDLSALETEGRGSGIYESTPAQIGLELFNAAGAAGSYDGMNDRNPQAFIRPGSHSVPVTDRNGTHHSDVNARYRAQSLAVPIKNAVPSNAQALDIMRQTVRRAVTGE